MDIEVLGSVEAWHGEARLPVGPPMQRCVLAMLALQVGAGVSIDRLVDVLWGEQPPGDARGLIHGYISRLRKVLRPAGIGIVRRPPGYALEVPRDSVDVHRFRALVGQAHETASDDDAARLLREGLLLWRGEPLAGVTASDAVASLRAGLIEERLTAAETWAEVTLRLGRHHEIVTELTELALEHPLRERIVGFTMLALHHSGQQAEALARYDETRRVLAEQLGLDPGAELRRTHARILRGEPEPAIRRRPNSLPFDVPAFIGRKTELDRLVNRTSLSGTIMISAIDGMAGIGKTALAVHAARCVAQRYPDGQLFIDLHGFTPGRDPVDPSAALSTLLRSLGVPADQVPADFDQRVLAWRTELADRKTVLVLDNAVNAEQVRPLIPGTPGCLVLVTSRRRMPTLEGALPLSLELLSVDEAMTLFTVIVGARATADPKGVAELVEMCGGLPLAVRLAATRLQHRPQWTVLDLINRLRTERTRLFELSGPDQAITATFELSYRYLNPEQQQMFRSLATHPGSDFDAFSAAALRGISVWDSEDLLESLVDHHLVELPSAGRYSFHDLLRHHALTLVTTDTEQPAGVRQLLDYFLHVTKLATDLLQPGRRQQGAHITHIPKHIPELNDNSSAIAWYATEYHNLLNVMRYAEERGFDEHVAALPQNLGHYLVISHHIDELMRIQEPAARAAHRLGDLAAESRSIYHLALTNYMACRYRTALGHATRCLALARELGDEVSEGWTLGVIGLIHYRLGDLDSALENHNQALGIQRRAGDERGNAICTANVGRTLLVLGELPEARTMVEEALDRSRAIGDINEEASNLTTLGTVYSRLGKPDDALGHLRAGLVQARQAGNADYTVRGLIELADGLRRAGKPVQAKVHAEQALHLLGHGRAIDHLAEVCNVLGETSTALGDTAAALAYHRRALDLARRIEYRLEAQRALAGIEECRDVDATSEGENGLDGLSTKQ